MNQVGAGLLLACRSRYIPVSVCVLFGIGMIERGNMYCANGRTDGRKQKANKKEKDLKDHGQGKGKETGSDWIETEEANGAFSRFLFVAFHDTKGTDRPIVRKYLCTTKHHTFILI